MKRLLGDNQYLHVSHSKGQSKDYADRFDTSKSVSLAIDLAIKEGCKDFAFSVTNKTTNAIKHLNGRINLHPCLPYAHSIYERISSEGFLKTSMSYLFAGGFFSGFIALLMAIVKKEFSPLIKVIINEELKDIDLEKVDSIGLLNITTDLLVGSRREDILVSYYRAVKSMNKLPVFYTLNPVRLVKVLKRNSINDAVVVLTLNEKGYKVYPSLNDVEKLIQENKDITFWAMSIFNGVKDNPYVYIKSKNIKGVIFGSSKIENIRRNLEGFG